TYPSEAPYPTVVTQRDPAKSLGAMSTAVSSHLAH
ncbi:MAG: thiamine diphosphokinase, partial [Scardovia wiggsiae]|nr:thiamine diphosphokinase [Scardovia wiggsiae]